MNKPIAIYDALYQATDQTCLPSACLLPEWNTFFHMVQCCVFNPDGEVLLLSETGKDNALYFLPERYLFAGESVTDALQALLSSLFGDQIPIRFAKHIRDLTRPYSVSHWYQLTFTDQTAAFTGILQQLPGLSNYNLHFVSSEKFLQLCRQGRIAENSYPAFHCEQTRYLHFKTLYRSGWPRVCSCSYAWMPIADGPLHLDGLASLIRIEQVTKPCIKHMEGQDVTITDAGYYWLQYAPKDAHFWLTVMFDPAGNLVQYYFDITDRNEVFASGSAWFYDLYLDIVLLPNGHQIVLDEDELMAAYHTGCISKQMFDAAYDELYRLTDLLNGAEPVLRKQCTRDFLTLRAQLTAAAAKTCELTDEKVPAK